MGSIKFGNSAVNNIQIGGTEIKKVYEGSTLIWQKEPINYFWACRYKNISQVLEPAFVGSEGTVELIDSNGNIVASTQAPIPHRGATTDISLDFVSTTLYTTLTAKFSWEERYTISTDTITFTKSSSTGIYNGTPSRINFSFD